MNLRSQSANRSEHEPAGPGRARAGPGGRGGGGYGEATSPRIFPTPHPVCVIHTHGFSSDQLRAGANREANLSAVPPAERVELLQRHHWCTASAAMTLGIKRASLWAWMQAHGVRRPADVPVRRIGRCTVKVRAASGGGLEKLCRGPCATWWPLIAEFFCRQELGAFGFQNYCKACRAEMRSARRRERKTQ